MNSLTTLNDVFVSLNMEHDSEKLLSLAQGRSSEAFQRVVSALLQGNEGDPSARAKAEELVRRYTKSHQSAQQSWKEEMDRREREQDAFDERERTKKPIVQCQVCRRTANYWVPCPVAPMLIGYEYSDGTKQMI